LILVKSIFADIFPIPDHLAKLSIEDFEKPLETPILVSSLFKGYLKKAARPEVDRNPPMVFLPKSSIMS
jgi:hypothetical protein